MCRVKLWSGPYVEPLLNECWVSVAWSEGCRPNLNACVCVRPCGWQSLSRCLEKGKHHTVLEFPCLSGWSRTMCESARLLLIALPQISNWLKHDSIYSQFTKQHFSAQMTDRQWYNYKNLLHLSVKPVPEDNFIAQGLIFFSSGVLCFNQSSTSKFQMFLLEWK